MKTFTWLKRATAVVLLFSMLLCSVPIQTFAAEPEKTDESGSAGSEELATAFVGDPFSSEDLSAQQYGSAEENGEAELLAIEFTTLRGKVRDDAGTGISGVSVLLFNCLENQVWAMAETDAAGSWHYEEAERGTVYAVRYYHPLYTFAQQVQTVTAGTEETVLPEVTGTKRSALENAATPDSVFTYRVQDVYYAEITGYTGDAPAVVVPESIDGYIVRGIGDDVFRGHTELTAVSLPATLESIGSYAFYGCTNLVQAELPNKLTSIGNSAFSGCTSLTEVVLPDSVEGLGSYVFQNCGNLQIINYPRALKRVSSSGGIFAGCVKLTEIEVPESVTALPDYMFRGCENLTYVSLPATLESIGQYAFYGCTNLVQAELPNELTSIGNSAFSGCAGLTEVVLPDSVKSLGSYVFQNCTSLSGVNYPRGLEEVNYSGGVFAGCVKLTELEVPEGVTVLADYVFRNCESLESVLLPATLVTVGRYAFRDCPALAAIDLPGNITSIGEYAFSGCVGLRGMELPDTLISIGNSAFSGCTGLTEVELPDGVKSLGAYVFQNCTNLSSVNYPLGLEEVNASGGIFAGCVKLTEMEVPEGVTALPEYVFRGCDELQTVALPSTLTGISEYAFYDCEKLSAVSLPEGITSIGINAFQDCVGLRELVLPDGVVSIGNSAFSGCTGLTQLTLPEGVERIDSYAFSKCKGLTEVQLPDSIKSLGAYVFQNCTELRSVNYPSGLEEVDGAGGVFAGCVKLTRMEVPEGVTALPDYAFYDCENFRTILLPSTLISIGTRAFEDCTGLRYIEPIDGLASLGHYAFRGCTGLTSLYLPDSIVDYGTDIFAECPKLTVECAEYSFAAVYCIDGGIPVEFIGDTFEDSDGLMLDRTSTYYVANTVGALANGYVTMNLAYGYRENGQSGITDQSLSLRIPSGMLLLEDTLRLNGDLLTGYEYEDDLLTIALSATQGELSFCLRPVSDSKVTTYAVMQFKNQGREAKEVIGIINEDIPLLSVQASENVNDPTFHVSGIGPADTEVGIYLDGAKVATAYTNRSGSYNAKVTIPNPENYAAYTLRAAATADDGTEISATREVRYCVGEPAIESFTLYYGGKIYDVAALGNTKPTVTFESDMPFTFRVRFSNHDQVEHVYICSTRSNVTKYIQAQWDAVTQSYVAEGYFDPDNRGYVPGVITVQYSKEKEKLDFAQEIDYTDAQYTNSVSAPIKTMLSGKVSEYIENLVRTDNQLSGVIKLTDIDSLLDFDILTDVIPSYLDPSNAGEYGYEAIEDDYGATLYLKVAEYGEDKVRGQIIDFARKKLTSFLIEGKHINAAVNVDSYFSFVEVLGYADKLITWDNNRVSLKEARQAILASSLSETAKAEALKKLDHAGKANNGVVAAMVLGVLLGAAGITIPFPCSMILPLLSMQNSAYVNDILSQFGFLNAFKSEELMFNFRWKIDPSGYVYDTETGQRLSGVTATAYWIEYDPATSPEDFWEEIPADDVYGVLWNAAEWDQMNPLTTDAEGRYAWDVPEGWWRVKYEKEGYGTVWSHWMTVPPVQTDVNVGLTVTGYTLLCIQSSASSTTVQLTNRTGSGDAVRFVLSAYDPGGKMVKTVSRTVALASQSTQTLTLSYEAADQAVEVRAFVLDASTSAPLRGSWTRAIS